MLAARQVKERQLILSAARAPCGPTAPRAAPAGPQWVRLSRDFGADARTTAPATAASREK
ncbi:hypothetical protein GCM10009760_29440 [Kitasatospora kazusensis]|uniref:Uncharacterized protein n=1 Tax=Kitasatospora kazusensis TaxID=407974 RepID=A0ABP5LBK1_9ACTN